MKGQMIKMGRTKITEEMVEGVCLMIKNGATLDDIKNKYQICKSTIYKIRVDERYAEIRERCGCNYPVLKRLTEEQIHQICRLFQEGYGNTYIAKMMDITSHNVAKIRRKEIHAELTKDYNFNYRVKDMIPDDVVHKICEMLEAKVCNIDIANMLNIAPDVISDIKDGTSYSHISKNYNIVKKFRQGKITEDIMEEICKMRVNGIRHDDICRTLGIGSTALYRSLKIEKFKHIRERYGL